MRAPFSWSLRFWPAVLAASLLSAAPPASAGTLSSDLTEIVSGLLQPKVRVIVQTNGRPTTLLLTTVALLGGTVHSVFDSVDGFVATVPVSSILTLVVRADVLHISMDLPVRGNLDLTGAAVGATAARGSTGLTGAGVGIAVLDSGIALHPDLTAPVNRIVGWRDLINGRTTAYDDHGHGTHVAGIIAGDGGSAALAGRDVRGIAPGARLIGVKVLDSNLSGLASTVIRGMDFCLTNRVKYNIRVVNLSLGQAVMDPYRKDPLCKAAAKLTRSGIVVVASAGNLGRQDPQDPNSGVRYGYITSPGSEPLVITVGATRSNYTANRADDEMATYSSRGPTFYDHVLKPDLVAPGNRLLSLGTSGSFAAAYPESTQTLGGSLYATMSGTSMAAPVVAGSVALMLQADSGLSPDTVKIRLMHSAVKRWNLDVAEYDPVSRGAGLLDVPAALAQPERATGPAASPVVARDESRGVFYIQGGSQLWGDTHSHGNQILWADQALWGSQILWADQALWGSQALWGQQGVSGGQILWADQALWGGQAMWAD